MEAVLFWHRRDLRIDDNAGLYAALKQHEKVIPIFIFDTTILEPLPQNDQRVLFIFEKIEELKKAYQDLGSDLLVRCGDPKTLVPELCDQFRAKALYNNKDYEPTAIERDKYVFDLLKEKGIPFVAKKDQVIFEKNEILKNDGTPYTIFTPYSNKWKEKLTDFYLESYRTEKYLKNLIQTDEKWPLLSLKSLGFHSEKNVSFPAQLFPQEIIKNYTQDRDFPSVSGTSRLGIHLRFGTVSIRRLARYALGLNETFLKELIWRDFYQMILYHFPHSAKESFKRIYDRIEWENDELKFKRWCVGETGYPLVDAGMRELNATGFMHNRVRMVVASFLCKHLLIDWRWGERYFAEKLLDFDLASNTGGWQWAAGCGCDAAPYFRVFSPQAQQEKFDPKFEYIKKWVPEFNTSLYPKPIVEHATARDKAIKVYKKALKE